MLEEFYVKRAAPANKPHGLPVPSRLTAEDLRSRRRCADPRGDVQPPYRVLLERLVEAGLRRDASVEELDVRPPREGRDV